MNSQRDWLLNAVHLMRVTALLWEIESEAGQSGVGWVARFASRHLPAHRRGINDWLWKEELDAHQSPA